MLSLLSIEYLLFSNIIISCISIKTPKLNMNQSKIFKAFALVNFIVLLTCFLLYRNDFFKTNMNEKNDAVFTSSNGGTSTKIIDNSASSNEPTNPINDSILEYNKQKEIATKKIIMSSSKSGMIFESDAFDSIEINKNLKPKKKKSIK